MNKITVPNEWYDVYDTRDDDEYRIFQELTSGKYDMRSIEQLSKQLNISCEKIEKVFIKYQKKNIILQSTKNPGLWGYWKRNQSLLPKEVQTLRDLDKKNRLKDYNNQNP